MCLFLQIHAVTVSFARCLSVLLVQESCAKNRSFYGQVLFIFFYLTTFAEFLKIFWFLSPGIENI